MAKTARTVSVARKQQLSPNMMRVTLHGAALADFPPGFEGGYVKLVLPTDDKPHARSYTVRHFEPGEHALTLDMAVHGETGPAACWATQVAEGDQVEITGPGACKPIYVAADWFILAGDMSALPAISVNVERLPRHAVGHLVIEIVSEEDKQDLDVPPGLQVHWVINPEPESHNSVLEDTVMGLPWQPGEVAVWVAGEFSASRALRQYFRHTRTVNKDQMYVSCYWKIGDTDEGMKVAKRNDIEPW